MSSPARFVIGIDLGTTNSAVAAIDTRAARRAIMPFAVPQLVAEGRVEPRSMLPSALYLAGGHDVPAGALTLPWSEDRREVVGELARVQGARVPGRLVTSAKSWLAHGGVDRTAKILPWGAPEDVPRLSPIAVSARILAHIRAAWDTAHPDAPLAAQDVVLTVPASFDEVARELTVAAAREAGVTELTLLEEPQAAFYAWLALHEAGWERMLGGDRSILVVDVGGGTTDFTLIAARAPEGTLRLERVAVGDHLLLGGDNMDIAVAERLEARLATRTGKLDSVVWQSLVQQCRVAKEALLAGDLASATVQLAGRGRGIVAGTVAEPVTASEVRELILEGFFPHVGGDERPQARAGPGAHEGGLPYAADPAIPRHLASFLARHGARITAADCVLYNGGVFAAAALRERMTAVLTDWAGGAAPTALASAGWEDAVARGAAYYGLVRRNLGVRVGGGSARACYLGLGPAEDPSNERLLCLVPRGMDEDTAVTINEPAFEVLANQPVSFQLYTSSTRSGEAPGALLAAQRSELTALPPIRTVLRHGKKIAARTIPVGLQARRTSVGTLELWCTSTTSEHRWRLEFQIRDQPLLETETATPAPGAELTASPEQLNAALAIVRAVYPAAASAATADSVDPIGMVRALESALGAGKDAWSLVAIRALWDALWEGVAARAVTAAHEARWLNLCGYLLRPGFGHELDAWRVRQLSPVLSSALVFPRVVQNRAEWWNLWKRIAGGLDRGHQLRLHGEIAPWLVPRLARKAKVRLRATGKPGTQEIREMWQAIGACERLDAALKAELGGVVIADIERGKATPQAMWALARLGARAPLYGPLNCVVAADIVSGWVERMLALSSWSAAEALTFALVQIARVVGDRDRDLDPLVRDRLAERLHTGGDAAHTALVLHEPVPLDRAEQGRLLDESLPPGLRVRESPPSTS